MNVSEKPYHYRNCWMIIKLAVVLHCFVSSRDVAAIIRYVFGWTISYKTICEWSKIFPLNLPKNKIAYTLNEKIICFADEKYVWIKGVKAYWWSIRDHLGNILAYTITTKRDMKSAKTLFRRARENLSQKVTAVVHDGLRSYPRAVHSSFGRKCKSILVGIKVRAVMIDKQVYFLNNNVAESLNAQIDAYLSKFHYSFETLESANRFADMFIIRWNLRKDCA